MQWGPCLGLPYTECKYTFMKVCKPPYAFFSNLDNRCFNFPFQFLSSYYSEDENVPGVKKSTLISKLMQSCLKPFIMF